MNPARTGAVTPALRRLRVGALLARLRLALAARQSRRALSTLPPDRLDDIGITPDAARAEAAKPIWDVPAHWRL